MLKNVFNLKLIMEKTKIAFHGFLLNCSTFLGSASVFFHDLQVTYFSFSLLKVFFLLSLNRVVKNQIVPFLYCKASGFSRYNVTEKSLKMANNVLKWPNVFETTGWVLFDLPGFKFAPIDTA